MRKIVSLITSISLLFLAACDVHEWPQVKESAKLHLRLNYETMMTEWKHLYDGASVTEQGLGETYDNHLESGEVRCIVRTYPASEKQLLMQNYVEEFVFTKDIKDGYDHEVTLDLLPGNYHILVWSDLVQRRGESHFYNADDFAEIMLQGRHQGNTDYRDAFYGKGDFTYIRNKNQLADTIDITMKRPLAKFEIVANDLSDFIESKIEDVSQCKVKIQYVGFMPNAYSLFTNKPVDSYTGVVFESTLNELNETNVSICSDYVFISDNGSTVTIRIGIYDKDEKQISMTKLIEVPLKPDCHTIVTGNFLMQNASGGININPDFDGNFNLIIP